MYLFPLDSHMNLKIACGFAMSFARLVAASREFPSELGLTREQKLQQLNDTSSGLPSTLRMLDLVGLVTSIRVGITNFKIEKCKMMGGALI